MKNSEKPLKNRHEPTILVFIIAFNIILFNSFYNQFKCGLLLKEGPHKIIQKYRYNLVIFW